MVPQTTTGKRHSYNLSHVLLIISAACCEFWSGQLPLAAAGGFGGLSSVASTELSQHQIDLVLYRLSTHSSHASNVACKQRHT